MHPGLATFQRRPLEIPLPELTALPVTDPLAPAAYFGAQVTGTTRIAVRQPATFERCLIEARFTGKDLIVIKDSLVAVMLDGVGFYISGSRIGSIDRPDGSHRRATEDGLRPCPLPGAPDLAMPTYIVDSDIINTDGRNGSVHMDGLQIWQGGKVTVRRCRIDGWWQSAVMLKSDHGPIDDVTIDGCYLGGAMYFPIRIINGSAGRPTNVTITNNVIARGYNGGLFPCNSGDDRCSLISQTKFVRAESQRLDPTWIVYDNNLTPDGVELPPPGGWYIP